MHNPIERHAEQWKPVPGYEDRYEVSDYGRVRSLPRRDRLGRPVPGGILKPIDRGNGYPFVNLHHDGRKQESVHVLVALAFIGPRPDGLEVRHRNGDPADSRLVNLTYGTRSENMLDKVRHGTHHEANKTHCPARHEYSPENTGYSSGRSGRPTRYCRACARDRMRGKRRPRPLGTEH